MSTDLLSASSMTSLIAPSILAANFACLGEEIKNVLDAGADMIHFDVMDNHYVPNLSFGPLVLESLQKSIGPFPVDVHLMIKPVDNLIDAFNQLKVNYISIHPEATEHPHASLMRIRDGGAKAGLVLNPGTTPSSIEYLIDEVDLLLAMSVNPGFGGQKFQSKSLAKLTELRATIDRTERDIRLEIDGGISAENIRAAHAAGADTFVTGTAIFGADDYKQAIGAMRSAIGE